MTCTRESCKSKLVTCIGADEHGERFQCRACTNEWYVKKPVTIDYKWELPDWAKNHKGPARLPDQRVDDRPREAWPLAKDVLMVGGPSREGFVFKKDDILIDDRIPSAYGIKHDLVLERLPGGKIETKVLKSRVPLPDIECDFKPLPDELTKQLAYARRVGKLATLDEMADYIKEQIKGVEAQLKEWPPFDASRESTELRGARAQLYLVLDLINAKVKGA